MERIASLIEQLQQAVSEKADTSRLVLLANMLQAELQLLQRKEPAAIGTPKVAVVMPGLRTVQQSTTVQPTALPVPPKIETKQEEEKILEVLQVNEEDVEAELERFVKKPSLPKRLKQKHIQRLLSRHCYLMMNLKYQHSSINPIIKNLSKKAVKKLMKRLL